MAPWTALWIAGATAPLLPLVTLTWGRRRGTVHPRSALLVYGLLVSLVADLIGSLLAAHGVANHWLSYVWAPAQYAVLLGVLIPRDWARRVTWAVLGLVAGVLAIRGPLQWSETVVQVVGGLTVTRLIWISDPPLWAVRWPVGLYCAGQAPLVVAQALATALWGQTSWLYIGCWAGQTWVRVVALAWLAWRLTPRPLRVRRVSATARSRAGLSRARRRDRDYDRLAGESHSARVASAGGG